MRRSASEATGEPVAPAQGWQDLRTVGDCLVLAADGIRLAPNLSATKIANILDQVDPDRSRSNESMFVAPAIMPITTVITFAAAFGTPV